MLQLHVQYVVWISLNMRHFSLFNTFTARLAVKCPVDSVPCNAAVTIVYRVSFLMYACQHYAFVVCIHLLMGTTTPANTCDIATLVSSFDR